LKRRKIRLEGRLKRLKRQKIIEKRRNRGLRRKQKEMRKKE
jgi:hypothetical protein